MFRLQSIQLMRVSIKGAKKSIPISPNIKSKSSSEKPVPKKNFTFSTLPEEEKQRIMKAQTPNRPIEKGVVYTEWMNDMPEDHTHDKLDK